MAVSDQDIVKCNRLAVGEKVISAKDNYDYQLSHQHVKRQKPKSQSLFLKPRVPFDGPYGIASYPNMKAPMIPGQSFKVRARCTSVVVVVARLVLRHLVMLCPSLLRSLRQDPLARSSRASSSTISQAVPPPHTRTPREGCIPGKCRFHDLPSQVCSRTCRRSPTRKWTGSS